MNKKLSMAMAIALTGMAATATAEDSMGLEFSANVAMTSDYVFRGVSQNEGDLAIQGGFDVGHSSGIYAGVWASNVSDDLYDSSSVETDVYAGWAGDVGPVGIDVGVLRFIYPGQDTAGDPLDTTEWHVGVSGSVGPVGLGLTYYTSDDYFATGDANYIEVGAEMPVGPVTVAAKYGMTDFDKNAGYNDYDDWSIGASTEYAGFGFDLTYTDTDADTGSCFGVTDKDCDSRVTFTVSKSL